MYIYIYIYIERERESMMHASHLQTHAHYLLYMLLRHMGHPIADNNKRSAHTPPVTRDIHGLVLLVGMHRHKLPESSRASHGANQFYKSAR